MRPGHGSKTRSLTSPNYLIQTWAQAALRVSFQFSELIVEYVSRPSLTLHPPIFFSPHSAPLTRRADLDPPARTQTIETVEQEVERLLEADALASDVKYEVFENVNPDLSDSEFIDREPDAPHDAPTPFDFDAPTPATQGADADVAWSMNCTRTSVVAGRMSKAEMTRVGTGLQIVGCPN